MKKITKVIRIVKALLSNPRLLNQVIANDEYWRSYVDKRYGENFSLPMVDINTLCPGMSEKLEHFAFLDGGSLPTDIALLKALCNKFEACNYFEIGTWRGESVVNVAPNAKHCFTLNLPKTALKALGASDHYIDLNGFFINNQNNITQLEGNSMNYDFEGLNQKFDLIFIDGDHHYDFVKNDTEKVFKHLVHEQSIIVWHDYAYTPERLRPEVMAAILDGTPAELRHHLYFVSNTMSAIFLSSPLETSTFVTPQKPNKVFEVTVEIKNI